VLLLLVTAAIAVPFAHPVTLQTPSTVFDGRVSWVDPAVLGSSGPRAFTTQKTLVGWKARLWFIHVGRCFYQVSLIRKTGPGT
jgi:hypothetical protein